MDDTNEISTQLSPKVWYAIRTFNCQEEKISDFLTEKGKTHFIPMTYAEKKTHEGKVKRVLVPVVHNWVFLLKDQPQKLILRMLNECTVHMHVLRRGESSQCYEIPDSEMMEFRALCDPNFTNTQFITHEQAEAKPGKSVRIIHGQFAGMTGKLCRVKNNYYFIKVLADIGVMMHISRWYCEVMEG